MAEASRYSKYSAVRAGERCCYGALLAVLTRPSRRLRHPRHSQRALPACHLQKCALRVRQMKCTLLEIGEADHARKPLAGGARCCGSAREPGVECATAYVVHSHFFELDFTLESRDDLSC